MVVSVRNRTDGHDRTFVVTVATHDATGLWGAASGSAGPAPVCVVSRYGDLVTVNPDGTGATPIRKTDQLRTLVVAQRLGDRLPADSGPG
jgi:hypothetical protein